MEKAEKDNIIVSLYTLRAGLSLVAQEKEAFEREVNTAMSQKTERGRAIYSKIEEAKDDINHEQNKLTGLEKERDECARKARKGALKDRHQALFAIWFLVIFWIACVIATIVCFILMSKGEIFMAFAGLLCNVDFWGGIGFVIGIKKSVADLHECLTPKEHKYAKEKLPTLNSHIESVRRAIQVKIEILNKVKSEAIKSESNSEIEYRRKCETAKKHVVAAGEIIKALENTYSYLIDVRDWENLDLIIYSLETRRADSVKEALLIVDNERRANRIVEAVNQASREICLSVNKGLSLLHNEMNAKFSALSQQITLHTALLSDQMSEIANETSMNRALLAQANTSSSQLAGYAEQIRDSTKYIASHI